MQPSQKHRAARHLEIRSRHFHAASSLLDCTYNHFNTNSNCPICGKSLTMNDFIELVVANPPGANENSLKSSFQSVFTKINPNSTFLTHQEMCTRLIKSLDDVKRTTRFLLRQTFMESHAVGQQSGNSARVNEHLQQENEKLKQELANSRLERQQTAAETQRQMQALQTANKELKESLDDTIRRFRNAHVTREASRSPAYANNNISNSSSNAFAAGGGGHLRGVGSRSNDGGSLGSVSGMNQPVPNFVRVPPANHASPHAQRGASRPSGPFANLGNASAPVPPPHHGVSTRYANSQALRETPRIRDLTGSSGYTFSSQPGNHAHSSPGPSSGFSLAGSAGSGRMSSFGR
jgi:regulator of replication initiation timing